MHKEFSKIYRGFWTGTIRDRHPTVRLVFLGLIDLCDVEGVVVGTPEFLAGYVNIPLNQFKKALAELGEPDPNSTTPDHEGRRVIELGPNRLFVVNHQKYYETGKSEKTGTAMTPAERQAKRREKLRQELAERTGRHVTNKEKEIKEKGKENDSFVRSAHESLCDEFFFLYPEPLKEAGQARARHLNKSKARQILLGLLKRGESVRAILAGVKGYAEFVNGNYGKEGPYVKACDAWLNGRLWEEYGEDHDAPKPAQAAKLASRKKDLTEPVEGVDFEYREVAHYFGSRKEWGVATFAFVPGTDEEFNRAAWQLAKLGEGELGL